MNITFERPYAFYGLLVLVPVLLFVILKYRRLVHSLSNSGRIHNNAEFLHRVTRRFVLRTVCRILSFVMIVFAYAGISWGTNLVPVQKSGDAVAFVFDISYSMEAHDAPGEMTRLDAAANYAEELLSHMDDMSVSVVLAKGNGTVAVPLTEDMEAVRSVLDNLSPHLMTAEGTSLGSGIEAAINSFPPQSAQASHIWVFTDGDETDNMLTSSLTDAIRYGIPVTLIGFGSERETEVLTGDGKTSVKTALRADAMKKAAALVGKRNLKGKQPRILVTPVTYIDASEVGSAYQLLRSLQSDIPVFRNTSDTSDRATVVYEIQNVKREQLFILLAILFFCASYLFGEFTMVRRRKNKFAAATILFCISTMLFTGCSGRFDDGTKILQGKLEWNRKNYQQAVADFLQAAENAHARGDKEYESYAIYGLASTYLMQDESEAALERFDQIAPNASNSVRFAVLYNSGIIAHRNGDFHKAASYFKDALRVDSSNVNAKINLELSLQQDSVQSRSHEQQLTPVSENTEEQSLENAVYSVIRENDENQWKNKQQNS